MQLRPDVLVEELDREVVSDDAMLEALRPLLDHRSVRPLVDYVAQRLGVAGGERQITFEFSAGRLRRTQLGHGPIGNDELEQLARV